MTNFFCSESSRQAGEDIIGSGTNYQTYILIESPTTWAPEAFDSSSIPENLKNLIAEVKQAKIPVRFLLISSNQSKHTNQRKILIYEQNQEEFSNGYIKQEVDVENISQAAVAIRKYLLGDSLNCESEISETRDILICTHGSHDKCCAKYGNLFYTQALATVSHLNLSNVRIWKSSHFGGHRFAPTMIDFPEGRYYGVVDQESLKSILTRTGDINCLNKVYRGWGILPTAIQVMERELILRYGWDWFTYKIQGRLIEKHTDNILQAEIVFEKPDGSIYSYQAELVKDENKTMQLRGSCCSTQESEFVKYSVTNICLASEKRRILLQEDVRDIEIIKRKTLLRKSKFFIEA